MYYNFEYIYIYNVYYKTKKTSHGHYLDKTHPIRSPFSSLLIDLQIASS